MEKCWSNMGKKLVTRKFLSERLGICLDQASYALRYKFGEDKDTLKRAMIFISQELKEIVSDIEGEK